MESNENTPFKSLQPICIKLARRGTEQDIDKLQDLIKNIDSEKLDLYIDYVVFPIRLIILKKPYERFLIRAVDFLTYLFGHCHVHKTDTFSDIFVLLINLLINIKDPEKLSDASEEIKQSVCKSLSSLVKCADDDILYYMFDQSFRLNLAQAFFVLIQLLKNEKSKILRFTALETIGVLSYNSSYHFSKSSRVEEMCSKSLTHFFPGLSSALISIICDDFKQGQNIIKLSLNIFAELIVLVLNDECYIQCCETIEKSTSDFIQAPTKLVKVNKDKNWFKETSVIVEMMMNSMTLLITHDSWKVRLEFLKFIDSILFNCVKTLEQSISILLSAIFALSVDSHSEISQVSCNLITKFSKKLESYHSISLVSVIEKDIHASTSKIIKYKFSLNDTEKLTALRTIQGYIQIFGKTVDNLLCFSNIERIFLSLINVLEFDTKVINFVEDLSMSSFPDVLSPIRDVWPKKKFLYFQTELITDTISNICFHLGQYSNIRLVFDYLLDKLYSSEYVDLQCLFLFGKILDGVSICGRHENYFVFIDDILTELLALFEKPTNIMPLPSSQNNISREEDFNSHKILQKCLLLEIIGKSAKVLQYDFRILLRKCLFSILEQTGNTNSMVSNHGQICLYTVASYCKYSSVKTLIQDNVDYIMNSITINFHHFVTRPEMAVVLSVCLKESNAEILPYFKDSINHLLNLLDSNQEKAFILLQNIQSIILSIKKWFPSSKKSALNSNLNQDKDLKTELLAYKVSKNLSLEISNDENIDEVKKEDQTDNQPASQDSVSAAETDYKAPPPLHVSITVDVFKRCSHLQSSGDLYVKILSLEIIESSLHILGSFENQLNPLVHELWPRFIWRFSEDSLVFLSAFKVLLVMAEKCRDFIRMRVLKDIVNKLINLLQKNSSHSLKQNFRNYQYQNTCKLHLSVLSEIGNLFTKIDVAEKNITELAEVCLPYLKKSQSKVFQDAAYKSLLALCTLDSDAMWLYYNIIYCETEFLTPFHSNLQILHFPNSSGVLTDYKLNL